MLCVGFVFVCLFVSSVVDGLFGICILRLFCVAVCVCLFVWCVLLFCVFVCIVLLSGCLIVCVIVCLLIRFDCLFVCAFDWFALFVLLVCGGVVCLCVCLRFVHCVFVFVLFVVFVCFVLCASVLAMFGFVFVL